MRRVFTFVILAFLLGPFLAVAWIGFTDPDGAFTLDFAARALTVGRLLPALGVSCAVAAVVATLQLVLGAPLAWWVATSTGRTRTVARGLLLVAALVPQESLLVPLFEISVKVGLDDTLLGLVLPQVANAFAVLFLVEAFAAVPKSLVEAARIDGCSEVDIFRKVALPSAAPALSTAAVLGFLSSYAAFMWPLVVLRDASIRTVPVALADLVGAFSADRRAFAAAAVIAAVPSALLYFLAQKHVRVGISSGAVKG